MSRSSRARRWFLSGLGLVYAIAFASLAVQIVGLVGERGILPVSDYLAQWRDQARQQGVGLAELVHQLPTLCWIDASDASLRLQCGAGVVLGVLLLFGVAPLLALPLLWLDYLSLTIAGQEFLSFQWDALLLEVGFFAIWLAPGGRRLLLPWSGEPAPPTAVSVWALRLLLFRFLFASGWVKLSFGDPTWWDLSALTYHYWTQPLPTPLAWYVDHAPLWFQKGSCAAMFAIELGAPWLLFAGRIGRKLFGLATVALMVVIMATGNYGFFEPLTIVLALLLFDDAPRSPPQPAGEFDDGPPPRAPPRAPRRRLAPIGRCVAATASGAAALLALIPFGAQLVEPRLRPPASVGAPLAEGSALRRGIDRALDAIEALCTTEDEVTGRRQLRLAALHGWLDPFRTLNTYGLFRVMTTERHEIVIEGSDDGVAWTAYEFRAKPGDPSRAPPLCAPHMPRLDWQMWFAPFGPPPRWFRRLTRRLLEGEPTVLALLARDPFPHGPPKFVRARLYDYRFTTAQERNERREPSGRSAWWTRTELDPYSPAESLRR